MFSVFELNKIDFSDEIKIVENAKDFTEIKENNSEKIKAKKEFNEKQLEKKKKDIQTKIEELNTYI